MAQEAETMRTIVLGGALSVTLAALAACSSGEQTGDSRDGVDQQMVSNFADNVNTDTAATTSAADACTSDAAPPEATPDAGSCSTCPSKDAATSDVNQPPAVCTTCGCTLTQGYWKNHPSAWPVTTLVVGGVTYGQAELLDLFATAPAGDASLILAHQLVAAMLNRASGAGATPGVLQAIDDANAWMATHQDGDGRLPFGVPSSSPAGGVATSLSDQLDAYNNGNGGPAHCK
jgi:hypothetical protein